MLFVFLVVLVVLVFVVLLVLPVLPVLPVLLALLVIVFLIVLALLFLFLFLLLLLPLLPVQFFLSPVVAENRQIDSVLTCFNVFLKLSEQKNVNTDVFCASETQHPGIYDVFCLW